MNMIEVPPIQAPKRTILVCWRDRDGFAHSERRVVQFEKGFGPYIRWNRHTIPVDAMQTRIDLAMPGPKGKR